MPIVIDHTPGFARLAKGLGEGVQNYNDARDVQRQRANDEELHRLKVQAAEQTLQEADRLETEREVEKELYAEQLRGIAQGLPGLEEGVFGAPTEEGMTKRRVARLAQLVEMAGPEVGADVFKSQMAAIQLQHDQGIRQRYGEGIQRLLQNPSVPETAKQQLQFLHESLSSPDANVREARNEANRILRSTHSEMIRAADTEKTLAFLKGVGGDEDLVQSLMLGADPDLIAREHFARRAAARKGGGLGDEMFHVEPAAEAAAQAPVGAAFETLPKEAKESLVDAVLDRIEQGAAPADVFAEFGVDPASIPPEVEAEFARKMEKRTKSRAKGREKAHTLGKGQAGRAIGAGPDKALGAIQGAAIGAPMVPTGAVRKFMEAINATAGAIDAGVAGMKELGRRLPGLDDAQDFASKLPRP